MKMNNRTVVGLLLGMALVAASMMPAQAQTPPPRPLSLNTPTGLPILPIMEGSYDNGDGSFTVSFGYHNRNTEGTHDIPIGPNNFIEPEEFNGMQPTHFLAGRATGVFTVTVPASMREESIWWNIRTGNGELLKVPGRIGKMGYTLDTLPRPQGSLAPIASFTEDGPKGSDPMGLTLEDTLSVSVGEPLTLTLHAEDPSVRDPNDPRFGEPIPIRFSWHPHQGAGDLTFTRHESTPEPEASSTPTPPGFPARGPQPNEVTVKEGRGSASVNVSFSAPGDYMVRGMVDNWDAPDSTEADQCCWTNMYYKVTVTP